MHANRDGVMETSTTLGLGAYALAGAVIGFRTFEATGSVGIGNTCDYAAWAVDDLGNRNGAWETGLGTVGSGTLARTTVVDSSAGGNPIDWGAGTKRVACSPLASKLSGPALTGDLRRAAARPGDLLRIFGTSLDNVSSVWFGGVEATPVSATADYVTVTLPSGALSGPVEVESRGTRTTVGSLAVIGSPLVIGQPATDPRVLVGELETTLYSAGTANVLPLLVVTSGNVFSTIQSYDFTVRFPWPGSWWPAADVYAVQIASADGECSLRILGGTAGTVMPKVRGVDTALGFNLNHLAAGAEIELRYAYDSQGFAGHILHVRVNGCMHFEQTSQGGPSGPGFATPTACYLGSAAGSNALPLPVTYFESAGRPHTSPAAEFVVFGDSTSAAGPNWKLVGSGIYTPAERWTRPGVFSAAGGGYTIANQTASWDGALCAFLRGNASVTACLVMIGVNDIIGSGHAAPTILADLQAFVNHLASTNPAAKIVLAQICPAGAYLDAGQRTTWAAVNDGIAGNGPTPITGVHARVTAHVGILGDAGANYRLRPEYSYGDELHPNNAGRDVVAAEYRAALVSLGLI
jgi:lysophospholipase L1-like esterase